jgi:hypothetical protein
MTTKERETSASAETPAGDEFERAGTNDMARQTRGRGAIAALRHDLRYPSVSESQ